MVERTIKRVQGGNIEDHAPMTWMWVSRWGLRFITCSVGSDVVCHLLRPSLFFGGHDMFFFIQQDGWHLDHWNVYIIFPRWVDLRTGQTDAQSCEFLSSYLFRIDGWTDTERYRKQLGDASLCHVEFMKNVSPAETRLFGKRRFIRIAKKLIVLMVSVRGGTTLLPSTWLENFWGSTANYCRSCEWAIRNPRQNFQGWQVCVDLKISVVVL